MAIPYLCFQENCEEAIGFYLSVFGGRVEHLSRFTDETGGPGLAGKVMHAQIVLGDGILCCADQLEPVEHGKAISLLVHAKTRAEAERMFDALSAGGVALQRLTPHPPPDDGGLGGLVQDRYGYAWILTAPNDAKRG